MNSSSDAGKPLEIGFLIYPGMTQLDATAPAQVLSLLPNARVHFVWKTTEPVMTDAGFAIVPTTSIEACPQLDVISVPGGEGQVPLMHDKVVLEFLSRQSAGARYVTSVCTGSLLLGAAGVLSGYKSACHWVFMQHLEQFGALPVNERVVIDRNRVSGGGVTAGLDFAFRLAAEIAGEEVAKALELTLEYDPQPPFGTGTPEKAGAARTERVRKAMMRPIS